MPERQFNIMDKRVEQDGETGMSFDPDFEKNVLQPRIADEASKALEALPEDDSSPFDFPAEASPDVQAAVPPNPITTQLTAIALAGPNITSSSTAMQVLVKARQEAEAAAGTEREKAIRAEIALQRAVKTRTNPHLNTPGLNASPEDVAYQMQVAKGNFQQQIKTAIENEAIDRIQDVAAAGDTTQARILMDRLKPERSDLATVWHDSMVKSTMLAQLAEKFKQEDDNEGWMASLYTGLVAMLQPSAASYLGNVDNGVGGFIQRNLLTRLVTPGHDLQNQAQAIWNMTPQQLSDYLPDLETNIRSNSTYLGVTNPDKLLELIGHFQSPLDDKAASDLSSGSNLDLGLIVSPGVGIVPYKLAAKGLSLPFTMVRAGARKEAAASLAAAHETMVREGAEAMKAAHGVDETTVIDEMMPSIINPEKGGPKLNISLNNEVNTTSAMADELLKELAPRSTERFANADEIVKAADAKLQEVQGRYGLEASDYEVIRNPLSDGTHTNVLRVTFGNPKGGLFATGKEAFAWRRSVGFGEGEVIELGAKPRTVRPHDEGFVDLVFHGTDREIKGPLKSSDHGSYGQGIYAATSPETSSFYASKRTGANVLPLVVNGEKVFGFKQLGRTWTAGELKEAYKQLKLKMSPSVKEMVKDLDNEAFVPATNETVMDRIAVAAAVGAKNVGSHYDALRARLEKLGYHGHAVDNDARTTGFVDDYKMVDSEVVIYHPDNIRGLFENKIIQDPSGGYANVIDFDIPETGFYTQLNTPQQGATSRFLKNISQTSDEGVYGKGLIADQKANRMYKQIESQMRSAYSPLRPKERIWFEQVVALQANEKRWLERPEIEALLERAMGTPPREALIHAVEMHRVLNDVEFLMRRDGLYRDKVIRGMESVQFSAFDDAIDLDARINYTPSKAPKTRVYNISDDIHYVGDKKLTNERMQELSAQGYILVKTEKPIKLKDGTTIDTFVGKKNDFIVNRLRKDQLAYSPGGHRMYLSKYQVKQGSYITQPDTGSKALGSPNTFVMAGNIRDARRWAAVMNEARIAVKEGMDAAYLDEHVFKGEKGLPSGEDFVDQIEKGLIDKKLPFEGLYDREVPSVYKESGVDLEAILGEEGVTGVNSYFRTTGRMYYSAKGDHMLDTYGELAPTVDPIKAQAMALFNVTRLSASFGDFKVSSIERWVNKYRPYLNIREGLNPDEAKSSYAIFSRSTPKEGIDFDLKQQMEGQRESIKRILGYETDLDRNYRHWMRSTAEWIIGDSDSSVREAASKGVFWLYENNPVTFLRGLAFDAKLGMFNIGQFFIQGSTMASAVALNPRYGKFGLATAVPSMAYFLSKGSENVLERLAKSGIPKLGGFADVAEWKTYIREAQKSGFFDLGGSHTMVNDLGPERFASSIRSGTQHVRELGRYFFYNVEVMNRLVAHRIAYGEALEKFGAAKWDNNLFQEFVARRAENYSFNMSNASKSWWQTGLMSIPTQFWAYNVRMIEALTGKNFTAAQKVRLLGSQIAMAGTAGVPVVAGIADMVKTKYGVEPDIDTMGGVINRGVADYMIYEMFGADVNVGERWGTGSWSSDLLRDMFGYSKYNDKTFADIALGSTYSITKSIMAPLGDAFPVAMRWMTHESGQEELDMTSDELMSMFRQISTVNHALQAMEIYNYGMYKSSKGNVIANDLPREDAVFAALGFAPNEMNELSVMTGYLKNRRESVDAAAKQIASWREEALTRPDLFEANAKKVNAFVKFLPADIRRDVLKQAHGRVKPSIYASVKDRFEKTRQTEQINKQIEENSGPTN
jgi:hypothetical protein